MVRPSEGIGIFILPGLLEQIAHPLLLVNCPVLALVLHEIVLVKVRVDVVRTPILLRHIDIESVTRVLRFANLGQGLEIL